MPPSAAGEAGAAHSRLAITGVLQQTATRAVSERVEASQPAQPPQLKMERDAQAALARLWLTTAEPIEFEDFFTNKVPGKIKLGPLNTNFASTNTSKPPFNKRHLTRPLGTQRRQPSQTLPLKLPSTTG